MKAFKLFPVMIILGAILISACAGVPSSPAVPEASSVGGGKALLSDVVFTGVIESMDGDQWIINGQTVRVDSSVLKEGSFVVGDTVKVEAKVAEDGSVTAQRVESPSAADLAGADDSTPEPASTQAPLAFDDSGTEAFGTVEAITDTSVTIGGQTYTFAPGVEIKEIIAVGTFVKLHFITNADGSLSVSELETVDPSDVSNDNSNADNSNVNDNSNDDTSNDNSNDDNSNDDVSNDDNSNDDDSKDDNSNDDDGNDDNSNDSNDND